MIPPSDRTPVARDRMLPRKRKEQEDLRPCGPGRRESEKRGKIRTEMYL